MYKEYLALNNLQWLICHKTKPSSNLAQDCILYSGYTLGKGMNPVILHAANDQIVELTGPFWLVGWLVLMAYQPLLVI